jgi:chemotaxis response regulator CheB
VPPGGTDCGEHPELAEPSLRDDGEAGGVVLVQNEATSAFFGMPNAAIRTGCVDFVVPLRGLAAKLEDLVGKG